MNKSRFWAKLTTFSAYGWFVAVISFSTIILISTRGFAKDPCFSSGCNENVWLLPMVGSLFFGASFFGTMILAGIVRKVTKAEKWKAPLGIGAGKVSLITLATLLIFGVFFAGSLRSAVRFGGSYNGQELFTAVNKYRQQVGLTPVVLSEGLCDNLVSRWAQVKAGKQHEGFEEWVINEGIQTQYGYDQIVELYVQAANPTEAVAFWAGSPGHELQLENPKWTDGCAYANEGYGVVVMSYKK